MPETFLRVLSCWAWLRPLTARQRELDQMLGCVALTPVGTARRARYEAIRRYIRDRPTRGTEHG